MKKLFGLSALIIAAIVFITSCSPKSVLPSGGGKWTAVDYFTSTTGSLSFKDTITFTLTFAKDGTLTSQVSGSSASSTGKWSYDSKSKKMTITDANNNSTAYDVTEKKAKEDPGRYERLADGEGGPTVYWDNEKNVWVNERGYPLDEGIVKRMELRPDGPDMLGNGRLARSAKESVNGEPTKTVLDAIRFDREKHQYVTVGGSPLNADQLHELGISPGAVACRHA